MKLKIEEDLPTLKFKGWWIPEQVCNAFDREDINCTAVVLLAHIDSLANAKLGCIASNEYLANKMKLSESQTRQIIQELIKLGLIIRVSFNGRVRELSTPWTLVKVNEKQSDCGETDNQTAGKPIVSVSKNQQAKTAVLRGEKQSRLDKLSKQVNKTNSQSGDANAPRKNSFDGFFDIDGINKSSKEYSWCDRLRTAVRHTSTLEHQRDIDPKKWISEFSQLLNEVKGNHNRITKVMDWYLPNIGKEFIPNIYSAKAFRFKFDKLESAMQRENDNAKSMTITLTKSQQHLLDEILEIYTWPKGSSTKLPRVIVESWKNYEEFFTRYSKWKKSLNIRSESGKVHRVHDGGDHLDEFIDLDDYIVGYSYIDVPHVFFKMWFEIVNTRINSWEDWSGNMKPFIWTEDNELWNNNCSQMILEELGRDDDMWNQFLNLIK